MVRQRLTLTFHIIGSVLKYLALVYLIPLGVALYYGEEWCIFLYSLLLTLAVGLSLEFGLKTTEEIGRGDAFSIVSFAWLIVPLLGAMPYVFSGWNFLDAFFESMSGFTTTGSTVLRQMEGIPNYYSVILWRSITQGLGGMGVVTLFIAILPRLGVGGSQLFDLEFPGPMPEKLRPRIRTTARILWTIYGGLIAAEVICLFFGAKLSLFDSVCISLATISTGGFAPTTESIGAYANPLAEYIIVVFMFVAGMNFAIHYRVLKGNFKVMKDEEFRLYLILLVSAALLLTFSEGCGSFRGGLFQAVSIMTTTGFTTSDFSLWHPGAKMVLLALMFIGGCGGSTTGGIKVLRILTLLKHSRVMMTKAISPKAMIPVKYNGKPLPEGVMRDIVSFLFLYILIVAVASIVLSFLGLSMETSISAVASTLGNVGPGLGEVGPVQGFGGLCAAAKSILILCMWLGRLELFAVLTMFLPRFWRG